jgi:cytoskeletal protein CcmA (bactofilin family)
MDTNLARAVTAAVNGDVNDEREPGSTILAPRDFVNGHMAIQGEGRILGSFQGEIECNGQLLIGKEAEVAATIKGANVTVAGHVRGNILATGRLTITSTGRLDGDARVGGLIVQDGGVHHGMTMVYPEGVPAEDGMKGFAPPHEPPPAADQQQQPPQPETRVERVKKLWGEFF